MKNLYSILGVHKSSSLDEIKSVWKRLASQLHPDKRPVDSQQSFAEVSFAYSVLSDEKRKLQYDSSLALLSTECEECRGSGCKVKRKGFTDKGTTQVCDFCKGSGRIFQKRKKGAGYGSVLQSGNGTNSRKAAPEVGRVSGRSKKSQA